jgi:TRAP-type C4-dicarboxylate transport system permease small subunit
MNTQMKEKIYMVLKNLDLVIAGLALSALVLVTFVNVPMRYVFLHPIDWCEEFQIACVTICVFIGGGAAFRLGSHVAIDIVVDSMPKKVQKVVEIIMYVLSAIILIYFMVQGAHLVLQMHERNRVTDILRVPYSIIYSSFPIGCALMVYNYTRVVIKKWGKNRKNLEEAAS